MPTLEFVLPEGSPDPCPNACGGLTEDPYGGPCKTCWRKVGRDGEEEVCEDCGWAGCEGGCLDDEHVCKGCGDPDDDAGHGDVWPPIVVSVPDISEWRLP